MLVTLLAPTGGTATVAGFDVVREAADVRRSIGVALQEAALDPLMTGRELMQLQATLHGIAGDEVKRRSDALLDRVGLTLAADRRVGTYSGGMRAGSTSRPRWCTTRGSSSSTSRRPGSTRWAASRSGTRCAASNDEGTTVFLTTQYLEEADQLADRVGIIDDGRMAAKGTPASSSRRSGTRGSRS